METLESTYRGVWVVPDASLGSSAEVADFARHAPPRVFARGERVHRLQDPAEGLFVVLKGKVKLTVPGTTVGDRVLAVCGPGDLFGSARCAGEREHSTEAVSLEDGTQVVNLTCDSLREVMRTQPDVALELTRALSQRISVLEEQVEHARLPVQARLAHTLLSLARRLGREVAPDVFEVPLALTQDELASLAGAGRISVTQALSAWRSMGIVTGTRGSYEVDVVRLGALLELLEADAAK